MRFINFIALSVELNPAALCHAKKYSKENIVITQYWGLHHFKL